MDPEIVNALPQGLTDVLYALALDLGIVACAVIAIVTTLKQAIMRSRWVAALDKERGLLPIAFEFGPLVLGAALACVPGLLEEYPVGVRLVFGLIAGFSSPGVYRMLGKRFPDLMASKQATRRVRARTAPAEAEAGIPPGEEA